MDADQSSDMLSCLLTSQKVIMKEAFVRRRTTVGQQIRELMKVFTREGPPPLLEAQRRSAGQLQ